jgi:hypothetical protein
MKKAVFICSHLYSGSSALYAAMEQNARIEGYKSKNDNVYESNANLVSLFSKKHKMNNSSSIYMDEILFNHQICSKSLYKSAKFIYLIRDPEKCVSQIVAYHKYKPEFAAKYYTFRLRRLCEMASKTPGAVFLTYDQLCNGFGVDLISNYLELKFPIEFNPNSVQIYSNKFSTDLLGSVLRSQIYDSYERYLYFLKNQSLLRPQ